MSEESVALQTLRPMDDVLNTPVEDMTFMEQFDAWALLDYIEKTIATRKKDLRSSLLHHASERGTLVEESTTLTKRVEIAGGSISYQEIEKSSLVANLVKDLLERKFIPLERGGKMVFSPDQKRLDELVKDGAITPDDLNDCYKVSEQKKLLVKKPAHVREAIARFESRTLAKVNSKVW